MCNCDEYEDDIILNDVIQRASYQIALLEEISDKHDKIDQSWQYMQGQIQAYKDILDTIKYRD